MASSIAPSSKYKKCSREVLTVPSHYQHSNITGTSDFCSRHTAETNEHHKVCNARAGKRAVIRKEAEGKERSGFIVLIGVHYFVARCCC